MDAKLTNIVVKEAALKFSAEKEVVLAACQVFRAACRRTMSSKNSARVLDAAENIAAKLTEFSTDAKCISWHRFQSMIIVLLTAHLQFEELKVKVKHSNQTLAMISTN